MTALELAKLEQLKDALGRVKEALVEAGDHPELLTLQDGAV